MSLWVNGERIFFPVHKEKENHVSSLILIHSSHQFMFIIATEFLVVRCKWLNEVSLKLKFCKDDNYFSCPC